MEALKQLLCWIAQVLYKVLGECTCVSENRKGACYASKKHHPVLPRFPDWLTVWLRLCFLFFTQSTHTHTTGSQVFSGSSPPQPLPYPSVSLSTRVREADWQGCGVYQWCDVFEHCLPLGDETLRWGSGVFVWESKRQREAFAPKRIQCTRMLQKTSESMGGIHRAPSVGVSLQRQFWFHDVMVEFHLVQSNNISPANKTSLLKPQDLIWSSPNN